MNSRLFYGCILGFTSGVLLRSFIPLEVEFLFFLLLIVVAVTAIGFTRRNGKQLIARKFVLGFICITIAFAVGVARFSIDQTTNSDEILDSYLTQEVELTGVVTGESVVTESGQQYVLTLETITLPDGELIDVDDQTVRATVWSQAFPEVVYGDRVQLQAELEKPEPFITDTGRRFDYPTYLAKDEIFYLLRYPSETGVISGGHGNWLKGPLYTLRRTYLKKIQELLPAPHAGLLGGLTVGSEDAMGQELEDDFRRTGISHIVVLSGYNVSIIADALMRINVLPIQTRLITAGVLILLFVILTGASATIVRAGIMAGLVIAATLFSRRYAITRALFIAGVLMVLWNPYILAFDLSFQLSFIATFGLILLAPIVVNWLNRVPSAGGLREVLVATIATQIFILPFILFSIGSFSLVSVLTNALVLPTVPWVMLSGFLMSIFGFLGGFFGVPLSLPLSVVTYALLEYELTIVDWLSNVPFSEISLPPLPTWLLVGSYVVYGILVWKWYMRRRGQSAQPNSQIDF